jgi:predicted nuclease with RNAse H fold
VITVGVDLAAEPKITAVALIDWTAAGAVVRALDVGADDSRIIQAVAGAAKVGIDCPLGWPAPFVAFISSHHDGHVVIPDGVSGRDWRHKLAYRTTDDVVHQLVGRLPLSVAADRIGHTAMRCAGLLAQLALKGRAVDRSGAGVVVEVYPAASLKQWGLPYRGYKGAANRSSLATLVESLSMAAPWLSLGTHESLCRASDDAIDAVVAGMTARAALLGLATVPTEEQADVAAIEGWIALPTSELEALKG